MRVRIERKSERSERRSQRKNERTNDPSPLHFGWACARREWRRDTRPRAGNAQLVGIRASTEAISRDKS